MGSSWCGGLGREATPRSPEAPRGRVAAAHPIPAPSRRSAGLPVDCGSDRADPEGARLGRRVEVDEALPRASLPAGVLNELYAHARETLPEECCGLIVGDERERYRRVIRCRNEL